MRPCVIGRNRDAPCSLALNRQQHAVVVPGAAVINLSNVSVLVQDGWIVRILQIENTPVVGIRGRGANRIVDAGERAWTEAQIDREINLLNRPQVNRVASDIARRQKPIFADLSLQAEVPLVNLDVCRFRIDIHNAVEVRPRGVRADMGSGRTRERIATRGRRPRIIEVDVIRADRWSKGSRCRESLDQERAGIIVERSGGCAKRRLAVALDIPCEAEPRREIQPLALHSRSSTATADKFGIAP